MARLLPIVLALFFPFSLFATASISGPGSVCAGATITLTDATTGGTWSSGTTSIATVGLSTGVVAGVSAGTVTISYIAASGTVTTIITVNASPGPAFAMHNNFCTQAASDSVYDYTPGGVWSVSPATADSISPTGVLYHRPTCVGCVETDMVSYTLPGGCSFNVLISTNPLVYATVPSRICLGASATAIGVPSGGTWSSVSSAIETVVPSTGAITGVALGADSIRYLSVYGCTVTYPSSVVTGLIVGHHVSIVDSFCTGPDFYINGCGTSVKSYFGDGTSDSSAISGATATADILHAYSCPGTYQVKQVLYNGSSPIDSISFSYEYLYCHTLPVKVYADNNSDCDFDGGDNYNYLPVTIRVDSNDVPVDTISATSGNYYKAYGPVGTIYKFRLIAPPAGMVVSCPSGGVLADTIEAYKNTYTPKSFGLVCGSPAGFDLQENVAMTTGRHAAFADILVSNTTCVSENATITMNFSPKYMYLGSFPAPSSITANSATWDIANVSADMSAIPHIHVSMTLPPPGTPLDWLVPGDTINSVTNVSPTSGDLDVSNNVVIRTDTVKSSYDPNEMSVTPAGVIVSGTRLQYTVQFENTGNDTAFNISVYDTLSPSLDVRSLRVVAASASMNMAIVNSGSYSIAKFDFPGINLPDSSHHDQCNGVFIFNINTLSGLPVGTTIFNHAGIFFDDNPAVITDTVEDIIGLPTTGIAPTANTSKVTVYPNPANDQLTIATSNGIYSEATISNMLGQELIKRTLPATTSATQISVNISNLPSGMYYVTVKGADGVAVQKFEKM